MVLKSHQLDLLDMEITGHTYKMKNLTARQRERQRSAAASIKFATPTNARRREQ